ncbi:2-keto-3-deoxy-phosphogluconate aldolase [Agrococcus baldri]|uniref:2-keto-3-deoxy-phosphogluconate aldolase n=1 Tax=Agrococcus baldri TaxID=153730 RepID=A0AA94KZB2_9MICO|nr:bifunctional 4-hydroxy-2-oxoglutarate aldolase/2-dehydro-3-deoxy-phosphogluconate aldolase [Agrococcus baldri]SFS09071.1 2-keto-3-deoxy-phosphogluconate aldolase [Agrococcus baldri]
METMSEWFEASFTRSPVMAILRGYSPEQTVALATRAWELGIETVEVPIQDELGVAALTAAVEAGARRDKTVGAGTVTSIERVERAAALGASFTVAPGMRADVASASLANGMPHLPGVASGTDVQIALELGIDVVKAFPASVLGAEWITAMRGPFPTVRFVATGGINARNARSFLAAGAAVVAVGSALDDEEQLPLLAALTDRDASVVTH